MGNAMNTITKTYILAFRCLGTLDSKEEYNQVILLLCPDFPQNLATQIYNSAAAPGPVKLQHFTTAFSVRFLFYGMSLHTPHLMSRGRVPHSFPISGSREFHRFSQGRVMRFECPLG